MNARIPASDELKAALAERGVALAPRLVPETVLAPARERVYGVLSEAGLWRDNAWAGPDLDVGDGARRIAAAIKRARRCGRTREFGALFTEDVRAAADALTDGRPMTAWGPPAQLLFTPPGAGAWEVPHRMWHLDLPRLGEREAPGLQVFTFLDDVPPRAGGTLVAAGSHRLLADRVLSSKQTKRQLRRLPWFRDLMRDSGQPRERYLDEACDVDGVPLQVAELCGSAGDVWFADPRLLHTLAPNASARPRLMVTFRLLFEGYEKRMLDAYADITRRRGDAREARRRETMAAAGQEVAA